VRVSLPVQTAIYSLYPMAPLFAINMHVLKPLSSLQTLRQPNSITVALQPIILRGITGTVIDLTIASDNNNCNNSNGNGNEGEDQSKKHNSMEMAWPMNLMI